jgi:hypothetical protein
MKHFYDAATGEMCFSMALLAMKNGKKVRRKSWHGTDFISINFLMHLSYCNLRSDDILAIDWVEIYEY